MFAHWSSGWNGVGRAVLSGRDWCETSRRAAQLFLQRPFYYMGHGVMAGKSDLLLGEYFHVQDTVSLEQRVYRTSIQPMRSTEKLRSGLVIPR